MVINGDILDVKEGVIIHGCNCQGVMGSGLAKQIKTKYPDAYYDYMKVYSIAGLNLGGIIISPVIPGVLYVVNAMTQEFYGKNLNIVYVDYNAIDECFYKTLNWMNQCKLTKLYYPKIGAGLANGNWKIISDIIEKQLDNFPEITGTLVVQ